MCRRPYKQGNTNLLYKLPLHLFTIIGKKGFFVFHHGLEVHGPAPEGIDVRERAFQVFQVQLNTLVAVGDQQFAIALVICVLNNKVGRAAVDPGKHKLVAYIFPGLVGNFPFRSFFSKT